jgi:hypothetical protein
VEAPHAGGVVLGKLDLGHERKASGGLKEAELDGRLRDEQWLGLGRRLDDAA